jgi:hypothetical protein
VADVMVVLRVSGELESRVEIVERGLSLRALYGVEDGGQEAGSL